MTRVHQAKSSSADAVAKLGSRPSPRGLMQHASAVAHSDDLHERLRHPGLEQFRAHLFRAAAHESSCSCGGTCDTCAGHAVFFEDMTEPPDEESDEPVGHCPVESAGLARWRDQYLSEHSDGYPHQGAATIVCNGTGDYRVALNSFAGAPCGIEDCVRKHEESHLGEWRVRFPDGCAAGCCCRSATARPTPVRACCSPASSTSCSSRRGSCCSRVHSPTDRSTSSRSRVGWSQAHRQSSQV
jgi:hypothetical protein